jgi:sarcosine oxidase
VLGLEQFDIPHEQGSSHGSSRVIRLAYFEDPRYVPLVRRAFDQWRELERAANERLLVMTGGLDIGPRESAEIRNVQAGLTQHQIPFETLTADDLRRRFPALKPADDHVAVFQADTGFLMPERGIIAHLEAAMSAGADCRAREAVTQWSAAGDRVDVVTARGRYEARRLVITAGPWLCKLVSDLGASLRVERQVQAWFRPGRPEEFAVGRMPIFVHHLPEGCWYGLPHHGRPGVKVCRHHGGATVDPDDVDRAPTAEDEEDVRRYLRQYLPGANGPVMAMRVCLYTNTPDGHFIIDLHPRHREVVIAGGFSGHGYKFAPVVGEIVADLATVGRTDLPIGGFALSRLGVR